MVTLPETMRLASVVGSVSGPVTFDGSGLPLGQSGSVVVWASAEAEMRASAGRRARSRMTDMVAERWWSLLNLNVLLI